VSWFYSRRYGALVAGEWRATLAAARGEPTYDALALKALAAPGLAAGDAAALAALDLPRAAADLTAWAVPALRAAARAHRVPLRFVTRRYDIGDGVPFRDDLCLAGFDFSRLDQNEDPT
jgi:hypothetical protein